MRGGFKELVEGLSSRDKGEHRVMKLMKLKKKRKNYAVFYLAGKIIFFLYL